jgi:PhzF family phenazine biosynthesis protein
MEGKLFIANAFAGQQFGGNPAAVIPLKEWPEDGLMQQIAAQNNLSETAFIIPEGNDYRIRWFTPALEVKLCGHATLAAAHIFFYHLAYPGKEIIFHSQSGPLHAYKRDDGRIMLDFPADKPLETAPPAGLFEGLRLKPLAVYKSSFDYIAVLENQAEIQRLDPDLNLLKSIPARGIIVTARGDSSDFVSRCFYPQSGIDEDPVTGSAHTALVPYWAEKLEKVKLSAIQLSQRRGFLDCELSGKRVLMSGHAYTYLTGDFFT